MKIFPGTEEISFVRFVVHTSHSIAIIVSSAIDGSWIHCPKREFGQDVKTSAEHYAINNSPREVSNVLLRVFVPCYVISQESDGGNSGYEDETDCMPLSIYCFTFICMVCVCLYLVHLSLTLHGAPICKSPLLILKRLVVYLQ